MAGNETPAAGGPAGKTPEKGVETAAAAIDESPAPAGAATVREWLADRARPFRGAPGRVGAAWAEWRAAARASNDPSHPEIVCGRSVRTWLLLILGAGLLVRLFYFFTKGGIHYPDEIFQYLEPAHWRTEGDGWLPWEYARGVRNWVLPSYYGALMELGRWLGLAGWSLHRFLTLHNALFSLLLIPAGYRLGYAVGRGNAVLGLLTAAAMALFAPFGYFAPHTLSEIHGLVLTTWAYALWMEQVAFPERFGAYRKAFAVGLLLGAAFIARYTLAAFAPLVLLDYNFRGRFRELFACCAGLGLMVLVLGLVDLATWGGFLHSVVEYVKYNLVEHGNRDHGVMPPGFYWSTAFVDRLGLARFLLVGGMLIGFRRRWRMIVAWAVPFLAYSSIAHKEERFVLSIWPFVLVAALAGTLDAAGAFRFHGRLAGRDRWRTAQLASAAAFLLVVCGFAFAGTRKLPMRYKADVFLAESWIGDRDDATGVLVDDRQHLNGGHVILHRKIPQLAFNWNLTGHRLFNYLVVYDKGEVERLRARPEFSEAARFGDVVVFRRNTP